ASSRSNVLTYMNVFDDIRSFFSKKTGLKKSMFSYNSEGACPECGGKGVIKTELAFMPELSQVCELCQGSRYKEEVLNAKVEENKTVRERLCHLEQTGLQYMTLGQSLSTLSGGEMQRLKLSWHLDGDSSDTVYVFDEPTTGLHEKDIPTLLECFERLKEADNTMIIVEHNLTMMTHADWLIDIGPGAGNNGGRVLYSGSPGGIFEVEESVTGKHLKRYIDSKG